jgi:hypothetical protein
VFTDLSHADGNWSDLLRFAVNRGIEARIVVCTRQADEGPWSEVLWRGGGYDVLVQPCQRSDLRRIVDGAVTAVWLAVPPKRGPIRRGECEMAARFGLAGADFREVDEAAANDLTYSATKGINRARRGLGMLIVCISQVVEYLPRPRRWGSQHRPLAPS